MAVTQYDGGSLAVVTSSVNGDLLLKFSSAQNSVNNSAGTSTVLEQLSTVLDVAPWGACNRFPQDVIMELQACGIAQATLSKKARTLWGTGLVYGKVTGMNGADEIFTPAIKGEFPDVDAFWEANNIARYFAEFNLDYVWFANCFPELVLSKDGTKINKIVHQESPDCRFKQMDANGNIDTVYLSKVWANTKEQGERLSADARIVGIIDKGTSRQKVDGKFIKELPALDMYAPLESLRRLVDKGKRNIIYPINFPSPGRTYYQLASWDGCRMAGWIDIASRVPELLRALYNNSFNIKYHIEIPEDYFGKRYGKEQWLSMTAAKKAEAKEEILEAMDKFLGGAENAYKSFVTYFDIDSVEHVEYGGIKITQLKNENNTANELLTGGTANSEIMISMGVNPNTYGAGKPGGVYASNQGGSNIREGMIEQETSIALDRQMGLEPFYLIKEFNNWPAELEFRYRDTVLTTLDKGGSTQTNLQ